MAHSPKKAQQLSQQKRNKHHQPARQQSLPAPEKGSPQSSAPKYRLLPLTNDFVFKAVYGQNTPQSQAALKALLNCMLQRKHDPIQWLRCENPFQYRDHPEGKETIMDIKVRFESGALLNLEMQVDHLGYYINRSVFYLGKLISESLAKGETYDKMRETTVISILGGQLFPHQPDVYSRYCLMETQSKEVLTSITQLHFLELGKIDADAKPMEQMTVHEKLGAFFKYAADESKQDYLRQLLADEEEVAALTRPILEEISADQEMRMWAEAHDKYVRLMATARSIGLSEGQKLGIAEGFAAGHEQGLAKGHESGFAVGHEQGLAKGHESGLAAGRETGIAQMNQLIQTLLNEGRTEDLKRVSTDEVFRDQLMQELLL